MKKTILTVITSSLLSFSAIASDGIISIQSDYSAKETANRFASIIDNKGLTLFARINHRENAAKVDLKLRNTEVIIFGNPKVGTPLMQCAQTVAIDLPQKALIWENSEGEVWFTYNDPKYLSKRHNISGCDKYINKVSTILGKLSKAATSK